MRTHSLIIGIALALLGTLGWRTAANASILFLQPEQLEVTVGQRFVVELHLDSEKEAINTVAATVRYDRTMLRPTGIAQSSSFLTLWPEVPTIHEDDGTITFIGGVPGGSIVIDGRVVAVEFEALTDGTATVSIDAASQVLLNDGLGTADDVSVVPGTYLLSAVSPFALAVTCATHPLEETWYVERSLACTWEPRLDAQYSHRLGMNVGNLPDGRPAVDQDHASYADIADGAYYFILSEKLSGDEWQVVARRRIQIDATAPLPFTLALRDDVIPGARAVLFSTTDATSGIARYELTYGGTTVPDAASPYRLPEGVGHGTMVVRAYDRAGNVTESVLSIPAIEPSSSSRTLIIGAAAGALVLAAALLLLRRATKR